MEGIDKEHHYKLDCKSKTNLHEAHTELHVGGNTFGLISSIAITYENPFYYCSRNSPLMLWQLYNLLANIMCSQERLA